MYQGDESTAMAYDNGTAALANNPATPALMPEGSRIDVMVGYVGPDVKTRPGIGTSRADAFYMPAFGYVKKSGDLVYVAPASTARAAWVPSMPAATWRRSAWAA